MAHGARIAGYFPDTQTFVPIQVTSDGKLVISGNFDLGDVTVGAVDQGDPGVDPWPVTGDWLTDAQLRASAVDVNIVSGGGGGGGGSVTIADGDDATLGAIADTAVTGDNSGTINAHLRGIDKILADIWQSASHRILVNVDASALPSGAATASNQSTGNTSLSGIATSLDVLDDWDESDRAKVNVIVGQAGVDGDSGSKSAKTIRVVLATDQPALTNKLLVTPDLPPGAATSAKQDTGNASLSSIDGKITAVNTGAVVISSGTVTANLGTIAGVATETTLAALSKAEDAVHSSGDKGIMALAVRNATATDLSAGNTDGDYEPLQVDANGKLWVNVGTVAVTGTVTANAGTNLNTSALALETGGNLAAIAAAIKAEDVASASADKGVVGLVIQQATPADNAGTDGDYSILQMSAGRLWVDASGKTLTVASHAVTNAGTFATQAAIADGASVTLGSKADAKSTATDTTAITAMQVLKQISASVQAPPTQAVTNAGTFAVQESGTHVQVDDAAFAPATSKVMMVGFQADETATDSVDEGDGGAPRMTLDRKIIVTVQPHTAGGWSVFNASSQDGSTALTNTAQAIKGSAGKLGGWYIYNPNATAVYVNLYNVASGSVTVGTTNPLFPLTIPPTSAANLEMANGITFDTAIAVSATTTGGGNTAPSTAVEAAFWYK